MAQITLPNRFTPRPYQAAVMSYLDNGGLRACSVWHRRAGKDTTAIHQIAKLMHRRRGLYWHMLPTQRQARKVVWDAYTREGDRLIDTALPRELRASDPNNTEMKIPMRCGSLYQLVGSDNYDSLVGSNPIGVVMSEWSLTDPRIWDYIRPILLENGGWVWFIYTPRGYNHGWDIKEIAERTPEWFYSLLTVDDTGVVSRADIEKEIQEGMPQELAEQEFWCSFSAANVGAIFGKQMALAERENRITDEEIFDEKGPRIMVSMDIGIRDTATAWFWQVWQDGANLVDYDEESGVDADGWIEKFRTSRWDIETIILPHDAKNKYFATKHSAFERFLASGYQIRLLPPIRKADQINAGRFIFPHLRFHRSRCERGIMALRDWSYAWDDVRRIFSKEPDHSWASHGGHGFSYGATVIMDRAKDWAKKLAATAASPRRILVPQGNNYAFNLEQLHEDRGRTGRILRV